MRVPAISDLGHGGTKLRGSIAFESRKDRCLGISKQEMQALFMEEAAKNHALPLDDRLLERLNAGAVGRPDLMGGRTSLTVYAGMVGMTENAFINTKNRSHSITADVVIPKGGANGVVLSQAGRFGGFSLYFKDGKPMYTYNFLGLSAYTVASPKALPEGKATIRYEFAYDGGGVGKGGMGTLFVNGEKVGEVRVEHTQCCAFSADEGADVGEDGETNVTNNYKQRDNKFTGKILKVTVDLKDTTAAVEKAAGQAWWESVLKMALSN